MIFIDFFRDLNRVRASVTAVALPCLLVLCIDSYISAQQTGDASAKTQDKNSRPNQLNKDQSIDPADVRQHDHQADKKRNEISDAKLFSAAEGVVNLKKISIPSKIDDLKIPAYLFQPIEKSDKPRPALVWVYGGIHDHFGTNYFPFIKQAVDRGFVVIAPEYRGASGYGKAYFDALDYGGAEVNDVLSAAAFLTENKTLVDPKKIGVIGWSHGGYISLLSVLREENTFACAIASAPVTNLVFRLSYKGPEYQRLFVDQAGFGGLPFQKRETYIDRSPLFHVDKLKIPLLVQVATNDNDVEFVESEMLVNALRAKQPELAKVIVFKDPKGGHYFNRQVDLESLTRTDTPAQVDSWNQIWDFLSTHLN